MFRKNWQLGYFSIVFVLFFSGANNATAKYTVSNPNATFFDVKTRSELLQTTNGSTLMAAKPTSYDCSSAPIPTPVDYYFVVPYYYDNREGYQQPVKPLREFGYFTTRLAALYISSGDVKYADCT